MSVDAFFERVAAELAEKEVAPVTAPAELAAPASA